MGEEEDAAVIVSDVSSRDQRAGRDGAALVSSKRSKQQQLSSGPGVAPSGRRARDAAARLLARAWGGCVQPQVVG